MTLVPPAPWHLKGQAIAFLAAPLRVRLLVNYSVSPVGPYVEHAIARLTLTGPTITQMSVTSEASMVGGRTLWGFPKVLEELDWTQRKDRVEFRRGNTQFRFRTMGPRIPLRVFGWTIQILDGKPVRVPCQMSGHCRLALRGSQLVLFMEDFELTVEPPQAL